MLVVCSCVIPCFGLKMADAYKSPHVRFAGWCSKKQGSVWFHRSTVAMQAAALGSSIGTAVVGGLITGQLKMWTLSSCSQSKTPATTHCVVELENVLNFWQ